MDHFNNYYFTLNSCSTFYTLKKENNLKYLIFQEKIKLKYFNNGI